MEREDNFRLRRFKESKLKKKQKEESENKQETPEDHDEKDTEDVREAYEEGDTKVQCNKLKISEKNVKKVGDIQNDEGCNCCSSMLELIESINEDVIMVQDINSVSCRKFMIEENKIEELPKENDSISPCKSKNLSTLSELKAILQDIVLDRICDKCKKNIKMPEVDGASSSRDVPKPRGEFSKLTIDDSIFSIKSQLEEKLGRFESKYKEYIKVSREKNEDGTIRQRRKAVTVRTDKRNPSKVDSQNNIYNDLDSKCSCLESSSESEDSITKYSSCQQELHTAENKKSDTGNKKISFSRPTNSKSEPACGNQQWNQRKLRPCMSADINKPTMKMGAININIEQLPLTSSINVNFCNLGNNVFIELRGCNMSCNEINQKSKEENDDLNKTKLKVTISVCTCTGDLGQKLLQTEDKCCQAHNQVGVEVETMVKNASTHVDDTCYIFDSVTANNFDHRDDLRMKSSLELLDFSYIFSKVEKINHDQVVKNEEHSKTEDIDAFIKECCTPTTMFSYIFSSYKRIEINTMLTGACSYVPNFPYVFTKVSKETPCPPCTTKSVEINTLFNDSCKRSFDCSYIFNHLKEKTINAMFQKSCMYKVDFPYIYSNVEVVKNNQQNDANSRNVEIENMFKNACKGLTEFSYILNHLSTVKIDNMIKDACTNSPEFPYIFSKVVNEILGKDTLATDSLNLKKQNEMCKVGCKKSCSFSYIFSRSKQIDPNSISCECENVSKHDNGSSSSRKRKFEYVFKSEIYNDIDNNKSNNFISVCRKVCDASTSIDRSSSHVSDATMLKRICKHKSEIIYLLNNLVNQKNNIIYHGVSDSRFEVQRFKSSCKCSLKSSCNSTKHNKMNEFIVNNAHVRNAKVNTSDLIQVFNKEASVSKLPSDSLNNVDINTMFKESCIRKNEFTYVFNNQQSCQLARRTNGTRLQETVQLLKHIEDINSDSKIYVNAQNCESSLSRKSIDFGKTDCVCEDSCTRNNGFVYVPNKLEDKKCCELTCSTSSFRLEDIVNIDSISSLVISKFTNFNNNDIECKDCESNQSVKPDNIKIDNMVKDACIRKNEFTYVFTNPQHKKNIQLARRTSSLRLREMGNFNKPNFIKDKESKDAIGVNTNFPYLLSKALESIKPINTYEKDTTKSLLPHQVKNEKDSLTVRKNPNCNYIFEKVVKPKASDLITCICSAQKITQADQSCCVSPNIFVCKKDNTQGNKSHSTCSFVVKKTPHRFLVELPGTIEDTGCLGIEVMWKPGCVRDKNFLSKSVTVTKCKNSSFGISSGNNKNIVNKTKSWCPNARCNKDSFSSDTQSINKGCKTLNETDNISLIRRMLESVKNVYKPFIMAAKSEAIKEDSHTNADNVNSLLSNSTTSTYSWKSCVMKTCQAEMECEEKSISYTGFSFGSSLDFASYKSATVDSDTNVAYSAVDDRNTYCEPMAGRRTLFDVEKTSNAVDTANSVISIQQNNNSKDASTGASVFSGECKCFSEMKTIDPTKTTCEQCWQQEERQKQQTCDLRSKSLKPSSSKRHHRSNKSLGGLCSCNSIFKPKRHASKAGCCCDVSKSNHNFQFITKERWLVSEQDLNRRNIKFVRKSRSLEKKTYAKKI